jgi:hypothetical protein
VIVPHAILTPTDRIIAGAAAAYLACRLWSGWGAGVIYGDGDDDVHADQHPTAFALTALSAVMVIAILGIIAFGSSIDDLGALMVWLWKA